MVFAAQLARARHASLKRASPMPMGRVPACIDGVPSSRRLSSWVESTVAAMRVMLSGMAKRSIASNSTTKPPSSASKKGLKCSVRRPVPAGCFL